MFLQHATPYSGLAGFIQKKRIRKVLKWANIQPVDCVLEVGCEAGELIRSTPDCKRRVGIDISKEALKKAHEKAAAQNKRIEFLQANCCQTLPFEKGTFTVILCSEMLEHVPNPESCINAIADLCTPETRVIFTVPNEKPKLKIKKLLSATGLFNLLFPGIEAGQSEWHLQQFNRNLLRTLCEKRFEMVRITSIWGMHWCVQLKLKI